MKEGFIEVSFPKNRKCLKILSELPDLFDSVGKDYERPEFYARETKN